jgi:hypothetical protein
MTELAAAAVPDGPFETFHPNGDPLTRGRYAGGKYDGRISKFASSAPGTEPLRPCCVPPGAHELRSEYQNGRLLRETFFDREGRPLSTDGAPWPERPPGVPEHALYDEVSKRYCEREGEFFSPTRLRYFDASGRPAEEFDTENGWATAFRRFGADGRAVEDFGLKGGKPHGSYCLRFDSLTNPYADARVAEERGTFDHAERSGSVQLFDAQGELLRTLERGAPLGAETPPLILGREPGDARPGALSELAERLLAERRPREALAVAARSLARDRDVERFLGLFAREAALLRAEVAAERARRLSEAKERTASRVLDELLGGAEPALVLRTLASTLLPACPASLDYAEASLLLAPDDGVTRVTRGLLRLEHGDRAGALEDAEAIRAHSGAAADLLGEYARVLFGEFRFEPADDPPSASGDELVPVGVDQPLERVERTLGLYATRIELVRTALARRFAVAPAWLPPDTSALLPSGPVELGSYVAKITDETEDGQAEVSEVRVDETLELESLSVRELMTRARADWAALSWLCWSVGLDRVALPSAIQERELFAEAANRSTLRCFWAHDRLKTEGLVARARKVPVFAYRGHAIQSMPRHLVELAAAEFLEVRALFFWLLFAANVSPFQEDLRKV